MNKKNKKNKNNADNNIDNNIDDAIVKKLQDKDITSNTNNTENITIKDFNSQNTMLHNLNSVVQYTDEDIKQMKEEGVINYGTISLHISRTDFIKKIAENFPNFNFKIEVDNENENLIFKGYGYNFVKPDKQWGAWLIAEGNEIYYYEKDIGTGWLTLNMIHLINLLKIHTITKENLKILQEESEKYKTKLDKIKDTINKLNYKDK